MRDDLRISRRQFGMLFVAGQLGRAERQKNLFQSQDGLLEADLEASEGWTQLAGNSANLFTYNGQVPGPRFEVRAGDTVRIHFTNRLAESTNLHFHGLHVPPTGRADNVFLEVQRGESVDYEFSLPANHPPGMFWYHPHVHGAAARQVAHGLAGLFIVRGELDVIPEVAIATEQFLVLKDWAIGRSGGVIEPSTMERMTGREGSLITAGEDLNPKLRIPSGGMLRLRILNASASRFYRLKLENHPLAVIATDGGPLAVPLILEEMLLSPGERADILVQGDRESGEYRLLNLPYNRGGAGMMGGPQRPSNADVLATMLYEGRTASKLDLPASLATIDPLPKPDGPARTFVLSESGMRFLINGREFDHNRVDTTVRLDTVEDWEIINRGTMDHPFHLHTNAFQILDSKGEPERAWKDVVLVPAGRTRRFRVRFEDFAGKALYHCHILDHEDLGMMGVIEMLANA